MSVSKHSIVVDVSRSDDNQIKVEQTNSRTTTFHGDKNNEILDKSIFIIDTRDVSCDEHINQQYSQSERFSTKDAFKFLSLSVGIIGLCVLFIIPWTTIPRTDSIVYQSHWAEIILPSATSYALTAAADLQNLITWTKESSLATFRVFLTMFLMYYIPAILINIISYLAWTVHLGFNSPFPYQGNITTMLAWTIFLVFLWFFLPSDVLSKREFRRKLRIYTVYYFWGIVLMIPLEVLSYLYFNPPANLQFLVPFMIAACREFDLHIRSKLVDKMMGEEDEAAAALIDVTVNSTWAFFITIRLANAEMETVFVVLVIDFLIHLRTTYQIIKEHRTVADENVGKQRTKKEFYLLQLILSELMEGFIPIIHGIVLLMAYHGPNRNLFAGIGSTYWGEEIEDLGLEIQSMITLFTVDVLSVVVTSLLIWNATKINMLQEFHRLLGNYWIFMVVRFALNDVAFMSALDINFGTDTSGKFLWINEKGWGSIINDSSVFTGDEK